MGEWSEHFEDFPEENPANFVDGKFDPAGAAAVRAAQAKTASEQAKLDEKIADIIKRHRKANTSAAE